MNSNEKICLDHSCIFKLDFFYEPFFYSISPIFYVKNVTLVLKNDYLLLVITNK